jgi:hypothetical protein
MKSLRCLQMAQEYDPGPFVFFVWQRNRAPGKIYPEIKMHFTTFCVLLPVGDPVFHNPIV